MSSVPLVLAPVPTVEANDVTPWKMLIDNLICDETLLEETTTKFVEQLLWDYSHYETELHLISRAADAVPRPRTTRNDQAHKVAYTIAERLSLATIGPRTAPLSRVQLGKVWANVIATLRNALKTRDRKMELLALERTKRRRGWKLRTLDSYYDIDWASLPNPWPVHELVSRPIAMPVDIPVDAKVFEGIFRDLEANATESHDAERGKIFEDGRLDMCKQVVGPPHVGSLMHALLRNLHVKDFLLGNNVSGRAGVQAFCEYLRMKPTDSHIRTWYIAGNEIDGPGMTKLVDAMIGDTDLRYLWLKRNPIGPGEGATALARLVKEHKTLRLLDLQETGLMDEGIVTLCEGLRGNKTLRTLYLDSCGMRLKGIKALAEVLNTTNIRNLYVSVNAFRDEGCVALAGALQSNTTLKRLAVSSVGMGAVGCSAICAALATHPRLFLLDLGFYRTTIVLRELPNHLTDEAVPAICELLRANKCLQSFSVKCCYLTPTGMTAIANAMETNPNLIAWNVRQFDWCYSGVLGQKLSTMRETHRLAATGKHLDEFKMRNPHAVEYIRSVYRGKM